MSFIQISSKIFSILPDDDYSDFQKKIICENITRQLTLFQSCYFKTLKKVIYREIENHNQIVNFKNILAEYNELVKYYNSISLNSFITKITLQDIKNKTSVEKLTDERNQIVNFSQIGMIQPSITSDETCAVFDSQFVGLLKLKKLKIKNKAGFYFLTTDNKLANFTDLLRKKSFEFTKKFDFILDFILEPLLEKTPEFDIISLVIGLTFKNIDNNNDFLDNIYFDTLSDLGNVNFTIYNVIYQNSTSTKNNKTTFALPEFQTQSKSLNLDITLPKIQKCSEYIPYISFDETGHVHVHYPEIRCCSYNKNTLTSESLDRTGSFALKLNNKTKIIKCRLTLKRLIYADILNTGKIHISQTRLLCPFLVHMNVLEHGLLLTVKHLNPTLTTYNLNIFAENDLIMKDLLQILPQKLDWGSLQAASVCLEKENLLEIFKKKYLVLKKTSPQKAQTFKKVMSRFTIEELLDFKGNAFFGEYYKIIQDVNFIWDGRCLVTESEIPDKYNIIGIVYNIKLFLANDVF